MADRTAHSHDTSTPTMSAETVPSEEFVRKALETIIATDRTGPALYEKRWDGIEQAIGNADGECAAIARAALATLSASHLAKEGEDDEETTLENRIDNAVQAMSETHHSWEARCHAIMAALGFNFGWKTPRVDEEPSPALAKGGDAVREAPGRWSFDDGAIGWLPRGKSSLSTRIIPRPPGLVNHQWYNHARDVCAALSTPTEGSASQTEGMGGDALRERIARALNGVLGSEEDEHPRHHPTQNSWEKPSEVWWTQWLEAADAVIAALTLPETAEAVPVAEQLRQAKLDLSTANDKLETMYSEHAAEKLRADDAVKALETAREDGRRVSWFYTHPNAELRQVGGWEGNDVRWAVFLVNGGRNDREWNEIGSGETVREAIDAARSASSQGGE